MPDPRFEFLYPPLEALREHLKAELARNPFIAGSDPAVPSSEDGSLSGDDHSAEPPQAGPEAPPDAPV